jgi:hypothetical protein
MYELGDVKIEARIVNKNDNIGMPLNNILLAHLHVPENGAQMQQDGNKAHKSQFSIVTDTRTTNGSHQVATEEAELRCLVAPFQRLHQV